MLGHKTSLSKFKKIEITSSIFSDHNAMKPEINHKKTIEKYTKTWKLNNMLAKSEQVNSDIKGGIKRYLETNENKNITQNLLGTVKAVLRWKFIVFQHYRPNTTTTNKKNKKTIK